MLDIEKWNADLPALHQSYLSAKPFPHIVLDNFLPLEEANDLLRNFPSVTFKSGWIHYRHFNENTYGLNEFSQISDSIIDFIEYMNSSPLVSFFERLTGIKELLPDNTLEGAGIHLTERGGHLNIHADFSTHPKFNNLRRRLNVLLYLNKNWKKEYRGDLEFWSADMKQCAKEIAPEFNRLVIFNTTDVSYHGYPEAIACPAGETRKSIALYYYNQTEAADRGSSTNYQIRPGDELKALPNWIDNKLLWGYTYIKRLGIINDRVASKMLGIKEWFWRNKRES